jgi:26S proteasome regulatory subunit N7
MDFDFPEPTLKAARILFEVQEGRVSAERLAEYLVQEGMLYVLRDYVEKGHIHCDVPALSQDIRCTEESEYEEIREEATEISRTGDYERFCIILRRLFDKNSSIGIKFDAFLCKIRILSLLGRKEELEAVVAQTLELLELGVDWARKNKFKVYLGLELLKKKQYAEASSKFMESLSTFEGEELLTYKDLVLYTIFTGMLVMDRKEMEARMVNSSEILEVIGEIPGASELLNAFFECDYSLFMRNLVEFAEALAFDPYLKSHGDYFVYFMKVRAYSQLFTSYTSISLNQMADVFGVSSAYMERDISGMIVRGDLECAINRENMLVYNCVEGGKDSMDVASLADTLSSMIQKIIK